jgi:hypothetical protein
MSNAGLKTETIKWHLVSHRLTLKTDGWYGKPKYEISSQWETKLSSGIEVQDQWVHKTFKNLADATEYYVSIVEEPEL